MNSSANYNSNIIPTTRIIPPRPHNPAFNQNTRSDSHPEHRIIRPIPVHPQPETQHTLFNNIISNAMLRNSVLKTQLLPNRQH